MGAPHIQVTQQQMENYATQFDTAGRQDVQAIVDKLNALIAEMDATWKGQAFVAFKQEWESRHKKNMADLQEGLVKVSVAIKQTMESISQADTAAAGRFQAGA